MYRTGWNVGYVVLSYVSVRVDSSPRSNRIVVFMFLLRNIVSGVDVRM